MDYGLRKISNFIEETFIEGGKTATRPVRFVVVAAVLLNPWAGKGFVENLRPEILRIAPDLGKELTRRLVAVMQADAVEAYGKAAAVGTNGEIEHASALIHTLRFGNMFREAVNGSAYLSFTNTRNAPGALFSLPMIHKSETGKRSHFLTAQFQIPTDGGAISLTSKAHPRPSAPCSPMSKDFIGSYWRRGMRRFDGNGLHALRLTAGSCAIGGPITFDGERTSEEINDGRFLDAKGRPDPGACTGGPVDGRRFRRSPSRPGQDGAHRHR